MLRVAGNLLLTALCFVAFACARENRPSAPATTPTPTSEPAFVNGGDCAPTLDPELPEGSGCATTATVADETLVVYAEVDQDARPRRWHLRLAGEAGVVDQLLHAGNAYSYPKAIGGADVDHDGDTEWFVKVADFTSHGAPWSGMNLFILARGRLQALSFEGQPLAINYGGISRLGEGASCENGNLILLRAEALNRINTRWSVSHRTFTITGTRAALHTRSEGVLKISGYNDPDLDPYFELSCKGLVYPPRPGG